MRKKSWFVKYFISYLAIGLLPIFLGITYYFTTIATLRREAESSNFRALTQAANELDYLEGRMRIIAYHFSGYLADIGDGGFPAVEREFLAQRIQSYENSLGLPVSMLIYFRGDSHVYTAGGAVAYSEFMVAVRQEGDLARSSFFARLNGVLRDVSFQLVKEDQNADQGESVIYLYPVPYLDIIPQAVVCFMLKSDTILSIMENYLGDHQGYLYLYNALYQNIFSLGPTDMPASVLRKRGVGVHSQRINGVSSVVMRCVSENNGFSCLSIMEEGVFYSRTRRSSFTIFTLVAFFAFLGFLGAFFLARRNYRPVRRLLANIAGSGWEREYSGSSEFDFILDKWNMEKEEKLNLFRELEERRPLVIYSCLLKLLNGEYSGQEEFDYYLKCANINFIGPSFLVMMVAPLEGEGHTLSRQLQTIIYGLEANAVVPQWRMYCIEMILEQQVAVVCNSLESSVSATENAGRDIAGRVAGWLLENYGIAVKIGIGRVQDSPYKINASFQEAAVVMSDFITGNKRVVAFGEVAGEGWKQENFEYPVIEQAMYIQSVKRGNQDMAMKAVDKMAGAIARIEYTPVIQCICFDIVNMMLKITGQMKCPLSPAEIKELSSFTDLEFFWARVRELTEGLCKKYYEMNERNLSQIKMKIINHINDHFADSQFSLQQAADFFDISPNYLSRVLKQEAGYSFIDYVSILRLEKAKELLMTTNLPVKDIVGRVGYMDTASFLRKFKTTEGITPIQFRERTRKQ
jgi:AraC-like DNA-binding protein